jgi:capsular polysaccharide biosynthesis protein
MKYGSAVGRGWWVVLTVVVLTLVVTAVVTARITPIYRATALMVVTPSALVTDPADVLKALETLERRTVIATFSRIPTTRESRDAVAATLGGDPKDIRNYDLDGSVLPSTNIVRIVVEGPDPNRAAAIANALAALTATQARGLYQTYTMHVMAAARPSDEPVRPDPGRNYLVAVAVGLIVGLVAAFALEHLRAPAGA